MKSCYLLSVVMLAVCVVVACKETVRLTQHSMCRAKASCESCLQLAQCAWCDSRSDGPRCFPALLRDKLQCDNLVTYVDHGLSRARTAECLCRGHSLATDCVPTGAAAAAGEGAAAVCSARGLCVCGRCVCNTMQDPQMMVTGKYCECDNYSCKETDGMKCEEGPYCYNATVIISQSDFEP